MSLLLILVYALRVFFTIFVNSLDEDAMFEEISSHQNVVAINRVYRESDWKNIFYIDISLKNDMRMYITYCKRDKNNDIVYEDVRTVNGWRLYEVVHYEGSDRYSCSRASDIVERLMGNSLAYLLDNYQTLYDLYMDAPEIDFALCKANQKKIFDSISDKGMFDVYDEETGKVIGVGKLFRKKGDDYEFYQQNYTDDESS